MNERPPYLTADEWEGARGEAKAEGKPHARRRDNGAAHEASIPRELSEDSLALAFVDRHGHELRYVALWGKWLKWTGTHWDIEKTLAVFDKARKICRETAARCEKNSAANSITKAKVVAAVEMLSRSDRRVAAIVEQWDADPWARDAPARPGQLCNQDHRRCAERRVSAIPRLSGDRLRWR